MKHIVPAIAILSASSLAFADFDYDDFFDISNLQLNGTAEQLGNVIRMTHDGVSDEAGNMWQMIPEAVGNGFTTRFEFRCDGAGSLPADGFAFGIQNTSTTEMGNGGGDNAMIGINGSVVVNFQSFWNKVQIVATDDSGNNVYFDEVGFTGLHRSDPWLAEVTYDAGTGDWDVSLDGNSVISANFGLDEAVTLTGNSAYVGLGAATGLGFDNNDALSWELQAVPEPATFLALGLGLLALRRKR